MDYSILIINYSSADASSNHMSGSDDDEEAGVISVYLPGGALLSEVSKSGLKPTVDFAQSDLLIWRLDNGLQRAGWKNGSQER